MEQLGYWSLLIASWGVMMYWFTKDILRYVDKAFEPLENKINKWVESRKITAKDKEKINFIETYECNMRFHTELAPNACWQPQNLVDEYNRLTEWLNENYSEYQDFKKEVGFKQYRVRYE